MERAPMSEPRLSETDRQWIRWGEQNPYYGVLIGYESSHIEGNQKAKFFETGEGYIAEVISIATTLYPELEPRRGAAIDFGSGVGRLLRPLAARFAAAYGVDISPAMHKIAEENLKEVGQVRLVMSPDEIPPASCAFANSFIVLQHIRRREGMALIRSLLERLEVGGVFALQFLVRDENPIRPALNALRYRFPPLQWAYNLVRGRPVHEPVTEMNVYDQSAVEDLARSLGFASLNALLPTNHGGHHGVTLFGQRVEIPAALGTPAYRGGVGGVRPHTGGDVGPS
ncbi:methyltransferase domain-containing protein [bacterium]|nr:methyltransferase domain-containing protein [bacterium]